MNLNTFHKLYSLLINHFDHDERKSRSQQSISNTLVIACGIRYLAGEKLRNIESEFSICKSIVLFSLKLCYIVQNFRLSFHLIAKNLILLPKFLLKNPVPEFLLTELVLLMVFSHLEKYLKLKMHVVTYGLYVQAVVNADLKFLYFGVIEPGSMNDSRSFNKCGLNLVLELLPEEYYMIGDADKKQTLSA